MPKDTSIKSILLIGSGPIIIGQACEFDYSGSQASRSLRDEGIEVTLINSNPATIMTDKVVADNIYLKPLEPESIIEILEEHPNIDAVLPTMGGQTALNTALALAEDGTLDRLGVKLIGAKQEAIAKAEDRDQFRTAMMKIGLDMPISGVAHSLDEAWKVLEKVKLPCIIRPSFTLGGTGGGIAYNREEFVDICQRGLDLSPTKVVSASNGPSTKELFDLGEEGLRPKGRSLISPSGSTARSLRGLFPFFTTGDSPLPSSLMASRPLGSRKRSGCKESPRSCNWRGESFRPRPPRTASSGRTNPSP